VKEMLETFSGRDWIRDEFCGTDVLQYINAENTQRINTISIIIGQKLDIEPARYGWLFLRYSQITKATKAITKLESATALIGIGM
jgi:hypothetical protein